MRRFRAPPDAGNVTRSSLFRQCKVASALNGQTAHLGLKRQSQAIGSLDLTPVFEERDRSHTRKPPISVDSQWVVVAQPLPVNTLYSPLDLLPPL